MNRHPEHPSPLCDCHTCGLEHNCEADTRLDFAVNRHTGTLIACYPFEDGWRVEAVNHGLDGRTLYGWLGYDIYGDAFDTFWTNAHHKPRRRKP